MLLANSSEASIAGTVSEEINSNAADEESELEIQPVTQAKTSSVNFFSLFSFGGFRATF